MIRTHLQRKIGSTLISLAISAILIVVCPAWANAWGRDGHRIVALIAERYLKAHSPAALAKAKQLLGGQSLVDIAVFADDVRNKRTYTKNWHYVDIPLDEEGYVAARDCRSTAKGDCAVQALFRFGYILANKTEDPCARAEALKFIVHLVGDVHQPLHNIDDDDAGGNGKLVRFFKLKGWEGAPPNLHQVWDDGIIEENAEQNGQTLAQLVEELSRQDDTAAIDAIIKPINPIVWVEEAHKLAQHAYAILPEPNDNEVYILDNNTDYFKDGLPVVKSQLRKAGLRLGRALERALAQG